MKKPKRFTTIWCSSFIRGGSWNNNPQNCRVAYRNNNTPGNRNNNLGFRLANTGKCARNCRLHECGRRG